MSTNTKKKFKDTQVGQFLLNKIPNVVEAVAGNSLAGNVIQAIIGGSEMTDEDKEIALSDIEKNINKSNSNSNLIDQINDLNKLKEQGIISEEEFKRAKEKILN